MLLGYQNLLQSHCNQNIWSFASYNIKNRDLKHGSDIELVQAMGCMYLKIAINVAQHQIPNLLQTH